MILVTVGMHTQPFDRLVQAADELAFGCEEEVIIQRGCATYVPENARSIDYVDEGQIHRWMAEARIVVSHGGAGVILDALLAGKPLVVVPRLREYDEHSDDHQLELAEALDSQRLAVAMMTDLSAEALEKACGQAVLLERLGRTDTGLQCALRDWLASKSVCSKSRVWKRLRLRRGEG